MNARFWRMMTGVDGWNLQTAPSHFMAENYLAVIEAALDNVVLESMTMTTGDGEDCMQILEAKTPCVKTNVAYHIMTMMAGMISMRKHKNALTDAWIAWTGVLGV